jgi:hypothetical protein
MIRRIGIGFSVLPETSFTVGLGESRQVLNPQGCGKCTALRNRIWQLTEVQTFLREGLTRLERKQTSDPHICQVPMLAVFDHTEDLEGVGTSLLGPVFHEASQGDRIVVGNQLVSIELHYPARLDLRCSFQQSVAVRRVVPPSITRPLRITEHDAYQVGTFQQRGGVVGAPVIESDYGVGEITHRLKPVREIPTAVSNGQEASDQGPLGHNS